MDEGISKCVVENLENALQLLSFYDSKIGARYAEYYVAYQLAKRGFKVQVGDEREKTSADIYLPVQGKRVEVKSSMSCDDETSDFYKGFAFSFSYKQLMEPKFDYLVCIGFERVNDKVGSKKAWVITFEEMNSEEFIARGDKISELYSQPSKKRKKEALDWADHPDTTPYLLYIYPSLQKYKKDIYKWRTELEIDLHKNLDNYESRWDKFGKAIPSS